MLTFDATSRPAKKMVSPAVAILAGVGGTVGGLVIGLLSFVVFYYWTKRHQQPSRTRPTRESAGMLMASSPPGGHYRDLPSDNSRDG